MRLLLLAVGAAIAVGALGGVTYAAFSGATSNTGSTFSAQRVYSDARSTSAWNLQDASSGAETARTDAFAAADGLTRTTKSWSSSYAANRYLEFAFNAPLPAGLGVSGASFRYRFAAQNPSRSACFYFEVRSASTGAVLATHGGTGSDVGCVTGTTQTTFTTPIPSVDTTDVANDLVVRVYGNGSNNSFVRVDEATVSASFMSTSFTLYPREHVDAADATPATTAWPLAAEGDTAAHASAASWQAAFAAGRYLLLSFPAYVPAGAAVSAATLEHAYRSATGGSTTCHYLEVYAGTTLIGTHGSAAAPYSCTSSSATFLSETIALPEVDTVAEANSLVVKMFVRNSAGRASEHDLASFEVTYHVD